MSANAATENDGLPDTLAAWVAKQRWYGGKGSAPRLERIGGWSLGDDVVRVHTHYLLDRSAGSVTLYQVPLTERAEPLDDLGPIGMVRGRYVYDAPHDQVYATTILGLILTEAEVEGTQGHRQPGAPVVSLTNSTVLRGEQSNTSIICQVDAGTPIILKVFRAMHAGDNPDVVLQSAISAAGSHLVPTSVGFVSGEWPDRSQPDGLAHGHLAFAQVELLLREHDDAAAFGRFVCQGGQLRRIGPKPFPLEGLHQSWRVNAQRCVPRANGGGRRGSSRRARCRRRTAAR